MSPFSSEPTTTRFQSLAYLVFGLVVFAAALWLARLTLPEWHAGPTLTAEQVESRVEEIRSDLNLELTDSGSDRYFKTEGIEMLFAYKRFGRETPRWIHEQRRPFYHLTRDTAVREDNQVANLVLRMGLDGRLLGLKWIPIDIEALTLLDGGAEATANFALHLAESLLATGEQLGEPISVVIANTPGKAYPILGADPPEYLQQATSGGSVDLTRRPGTAEEAMDDSRFFSISNALLLLVPILVLALLSVGIFIRLSLQQRIAFKNAACIAVPIMLLMVLRNFSIRAEGLLYLLDVFIGPAFFGLAIFLLWSVGESWHRTSRPGFVNNLDWLRRGLLGPRAAHALLGGFALGAVMAALRLAIPAIAVQTSLANPNGSAFSLPTGFFAANALKEGALTAGVVLLLLAMFLRILPDRWAALATAVTGALLLHGPFGSFGASTLANLFFLGAILYAHHRWNITGLLTTSMVGWLLPVVTFSALHADWMGGSLVTGGAVLALPLVTGFLGLSRPEPEDDARSVAPAFVRRIEEQRRQRYELNLLAQLQRGLLPTTLPQVNGYQIAARSELATEAGGDLYHFLYDRRQRLWVAAGDVAGHGYSCAIAQAMTKAALVSLIGETDSPAQLLRELDRVLRTGGVERHFTSLALLCLEPTTGEMVISNAGHPYPMHLSHREVQEIAIPSLPLGQGPDRAYTDREVQLGVGDALMLYSDGLYEATSPDGHPYGFDRPKEALAVSGPATATEILEGVLADWRRHLAFAAPPDDTTLVVIKRAQAV